MADKKKMTDVQKYERILRAGDKAKTPKQRAMALKLRDQVFNRFTANDPLRPR